MRKEFAIRALEGLINEIDNSQLDLQDKKDLLLAIKVLIYYYQTEYDAIMKCSMDVVLSKKLYKLESHITEYMVALNEAIWGMNDVNGTIEYIYSKIGYDKRKGRLKGKRLI